MGRRARRPPRAPRRQLAGARAVPCRRARPPLRGHRRPLAGDRRPAPEPGDEPRQRTRLQHGDRPAAAARGAPARDALASRRPVGSTGGRGHARADPAHAQPAGLDGARPPPVGLDRARRARPPWDRVALRRGLAAARRAAHRAGPAHAPRRPRRARRLSGRRARGRSGGALAHPDGQVGRQRRGRGGELEQRGLDRHGPRDHRDRDAVVGAAGDLDLVAGADLALAHDAQVRARSLRPCEALEHLRVAEAQAELEARKARLADLELDRAEPPALADQRPAHVDARDREVLAERARPELDAELALPPRGVLARVRVDRLVRAAVDAAVGLVVAGEVHALDPHAVVDRRLADRALHGPAAALADRLRAADVDGEQGGHRETWSQRRLAWTLVAPTIWTVGYEKLLPPALVAELQAAGVRRVIDVRFRPQSRRPGMSKTRLGALLHEHGIAYEHRRELGTPPDMRWLFHAGRLAEATAAYRAHVARETPEAIDELAAELDAAPATALLCLEADPAGCHRRVITEALRERRPELRVVDL